MCFNLYNMMESDMLKRLITRVLPISMAFCANISAQSLILTSSDIETDKFMSAKHEFKGFGCSGENTSPELSWHGAPKGTAAFALMVHDPDAPTGSGWWHWQILNIPNDVNRLVSGAGDISHHHVPDGVIHIKNDYGFKGFGGACPPQGHGIHRYRFTLHALSKKLELPEDASAALASYMVNSHSLASSTIEALYKR